MITATAPTTTSTKPFARLHGDSILLISMGRVSFTLDHHINEAMFIERYEGRNRFVCGKIKTPEAMQAILSFIKIMRTDRKLEEDKDFVMGLYNLVGSAWEDSEHFAGTEPARHREDQ